MVKMHGSNAHFWDLIFILLFNSNDVTVKAVHNLYVIVLSYFRLSPPCCARGLFSDLSKEEPHSS